MGVPKTRLSTRMTGSARETEGRIRALYQRRRRPALALMVLAALAAVLCGGLVSCQQRTVPVGLAMDTQYYDAWGNYIEIPVLTAEGGELPPGAAAVNEALAALRSQYQATMAAPTNQVGDNLCLFYPADTERYCNLVFYLGDTSSGNDGNVITWVYDREEDRTLTAEDAFDLAGLTQEELFADVVDALNGELAEHQVPEAPTAAQDPALEGFRIKAGGGVEFYLTCLVDDADPAVDALDGWQHLLVWSDGTVTHYDCRTSTTGHTPLIPAEELESFDPPLWYQWSQGDGAPEGGFTGTQIPGEVAEQIDAYLSEAGYDVTHSSILLRTTFDDLSGLSFAPGWDGADALECYVAYSTTSDTWSPVHMLFFRTGDAYTYAGAVDASDYLTVDSTRLAAPAPYNLAVMRYLWGEQGILTEVPGLDDLLRGNPVPMGLRAPVLAYFYQQQGTGQAGTQIYFVGDLPLEPRDGDLRIDSLEYLGLTRTDSDYGVAYQVTSSGYENGVWMAREPSRLVLGLSPDGAFEGVRGEDWTDRPVADIILEQTYGLINAEVSLWRDGYQTPTGLGGCGFRIFDDSPVVDYPELEPLYHEGDLWRSYQWEDFSALAYCNADYTVFTEFWNFSLFQIDTTRTDLATYRGIRVGSTRSEVRAAYGEELYDTDYWTLYPGEDYLWYCDNPEGWGAAILFFFDGDTVRRIVLNNMLD